MQTTRLYFTSKYRQPDDHRGAGYLVYDPFDKKHFVPYAYIGDERLHAVEVAIQTINSASEKKNGPIINVIKHDIHSIPGVKNHNIHVLDIVYVKA